MVREDREKVNAARTGYVVGNTCIAAQRTIKKAVRWDDRERTASHRTRIPTEYSPNRNYYSNNSKNDQNCN
eukprot:5773664-Amphidinium_carterae.1